jgi:hypothetical protein
MRVCLFRRLIVVVFISIAFSRAASAQTEPRPSMSNMTREGSGTSWLPDESPVYVIHNAVGPWILMFHENIFAQYLYEPGPRGSRQFGSINWAMGAAQRSLGPGTFGLRVMASAEPITIRGCGYPDLLASGETCDGAPIHDRQHPHDLIMEMAATYDAPLTGSARWQVYGGAAGEPALGPVAFPHRVSAMASPLAPISHHWLDATHITFGVVTGGIYSRRWKAEGSIFNGREPDEHRFGFDFGKLDSASARVWFLPTSRLAFQVSAGRLTDAEDDHGSPVDVVRATASMTYHRPIMNGLWATTIAWGGNGEPDRRSHAVLVESTLSLRDRHTFNARIETVNKDAHDLDIIGSDAAFVVTKLQGGYTRYVSPRRGFQPGAGIGASIGIVPESLRSEYGARANVGFAVYLTLRPAR